MANFELLVPSIAPARTPAMRLWYGAGLRATGTVGAAVEADMRETCERDWRSYRST